MGAIDTFCEYQIVLVAVGKTRKYANVMLFGNINKIALVALGKTSEHCAFS